jgi:hypothetical protein
VSDQSEMQMSWENAKTGAKMSNLKLKKGETFEAGIDRMSELGWVLDPPAIVSGLTEEGSRNLIHPKSMDKHKSKLVPLTTDSETTKDDEEEADEEDRE